MNTLYRSRLLTMARPIITPRLRSRFEPAALGQVDAGLSATEGVHESSTSSEADRDLDEEAGRLTTPPATRPTEASGDHQVVADRETSPTLQRTPEPMSAAPDQLARSSANAESTPTSVQGMARTQTRANDRFEQVADAASTVTASPRLPGLRRGHHVPEPQAGENVEPSHTEPVGVVPTSGRTAKVEPIRSAPVAETPTAAIPPPQRRAPVDEPLRVTAGSESHSVPTSQLPGACLAEQRGPSPANSPDSAQGPRHVRQAGELIAPWPDAPLQLEIGHAQRDTERHEDNVEIQVRIGRIEIRTDAPPAPPASQRRKEPANTSSLSDYLRARSQGRAG